MKRNDEVEAKFWRTISVDPDETFGINHRYNDEAGFWYVYNSEVQNHKQVKVGDFLFVGNRDRLLGAGQISQILASPDVLMLARCPACNRTNIAKRSRKLPSFKCRECKHEFEQIEWDLINGCVYAAAFDGNWQQAEGRICGEMLKQASVQPSCRLSIREIDIGKLALNALEPNVARFIDERLCARPHGNEGALAKAG